jgi:hypothetical protein
MSKFQSTISTVAALASIFGAGAAGWKLAQTQPDYKPKEPQPAIEQKLTELEQKIESKLATPPAIQLPPQSQLQGSTPAAVVLPAVTPPPPVPPAPEAPTTP